LTLTFNWQEKNTVLLELKCKTHITQINAKLQLILFAVKTVILINLSSLSS